MQSDTPSLMAVGALCALALGLLAWPLIEYGVHGILAHRLRTFVSPLHWTHHRDPRAVFTSPAAVVPGAGVVLAVSWLLMGAVLGVGFTLGVVLGFFHYEYVHWRIHFREPRSAREERLRRHHLAHHYRKPRAYHGVTTSFWDRMLGTLPPGFESDYRRVADRPVLEAERGFISSCLERWSPRSFARELSQLRRSG